MRKSTLVVSGVLCVLLATALALGQQPIYDVFKLSQDGSAIPDVNKNPFPPVAADNSCWQVVAADMLAGAGWGKAGQTAQQNADAIYGHLTNHFTKLWPGFEERAINWWLLNYGYNPDAPDTAYYAPEKKYNDVTHVNRSLLAADYDFLLNELKRCQYVGVSFAIPNSEVGHAMTLVGGNYSPMWMPPGNPQAAVWHDGDRNNVAPGDDAYNNNFAGGVGQWTIDYQRDGVPNNDYLAENYTTLCPGVQKPKAAIDNYDVAFYRDMDPATGQWFRTFREAGVKKDVFADPYWEDSMTLVIDNEYVQDYRKDVYLLVDYLDRNNDADPGILLTTPLGQGLSPTSVTFSPDFGQILLYWALDYQPEWEKIVFPNVYYHDLSMDVKDFNIATNCVPEPAGLMMLAALGGLALRRRG